MLFQHFKALLKQRGRMIRKVFHAIMVISSFTSPTHSFLIERFNSPWIYAILGEEIA